MTNAWGEAGSKASPMDAIWMARAVELAGKGIGATHPNPVVGCVITDSGGHPVGEGWHERAGGPHAEVNALRMAGPRARGGTAYVTLEPCDHTGRTGPCSLALIEAGVARVVYAVADPNDHAKGGAGTLRAKDIEVVQGVLETEAEAVNHVWLHAVRNQRPFVTWKFATTLDGRSAAPDRSSKWITGSAARADVHRRRAECDAIAVGIQTVIDDDPELTARDSGDRPLRRQPLRVVVGHREIPATAKVRTGSALPTAPPQPGSALPTAPPQPSSALPTAPPQPSSALPTAPPQPTRAETLHLPTHDPLEVLRQLDDRQIRHLWLEGGPTLAAAFVRARLVDELIAYVAPALLGGGFAAVGDLGAESIDHLRRFNLTDVTRLGDDLRLTLTPQPWTFEGAG